MDFSEIDIWWLLNKRARFKLETPEIQNTIVYLYNKDYENRNNNPDIFAALDVFGVNCKPISSEPNYLDSIFNSIT